MRMTCMARRLQRWWRRVMGSEQFQKVSEVLDAFDAAKLVAHSSVREALTEAWTASKRQDVKKVILAVHAVAAAMEGLKLDEACRAEEQQRRHAEVDCRRVQVAEKHEQSQARSQEQHNKAVAAILQIRSELENQSNTVEQALQATNQVQATVSKHEKAIEMLAGLKAMFEQHVSQVEADRLKQADLDATKFEPLAARQTVQQATEGERQSMLRVLDVIRNEMKGMQSQHALLVARLEFQEQEEKAEAAIPLQVEAAVQDMRTHFEKDMLALGTTLQETVERLSHEVGARRDLQEQHQQLRGALTEHEGKLRQQQDVLKTSLDGRLSALEAAWLAGDADANACSSLHHASWFQPEDEQLRRVVTEQHEQTERQLSEIQAMLHSLDK